MRFIVGIGMLRHLSLSITVLIEIVEYLEREDIMACLCDPKILLLSCIQCESGRGLVVAAVGERRRSRSSGGPGLSSGLTMNHLVSRVRCLLAILWMCLDTCRNPVANRNMIIRDAPSDSSSSESWWEVVERTDLSSGSRSRGVVSTLEGSGQDISSHLELFGNWSGWAGTSNQALDFMMNEIVWQRWIWMIRHVVKFKMWTDSWGLEFWTGDALAFFPFINRVDLWGDICSSFENLLLSKFLFWYVRCLIRAMNEGKEGWRRLLCP